MKIPDLRVLIIPHVPILDHSAMPNESYFEKMWTAAYMMYGLELIQKRNEF